MPTPALLTSTSSRPNRCWTWATAVLMDVSSVTSSCTVDRDPLGLADSSSDMAVWAFSRDRLAMMTWKVAEALTSTFEAAKPMPELAPVYFC